MNAEVEAGLWLIVWLLILDYGLAWVTNAYFKLMEFARECALSGPEWEHL